MRSIVIGFWVLVILTLSFVFSYAEEQTPAVSQPEAEAVSEPPVSGGEAREYNYGDMNSQTLLANAWQSSEVKDYDAVYAYAGKCIDLYRAKALAMQASLTDFAAKGTEFDQWALNDVGTCYFIKGKALKEQGKTAEAKEALNTVINEFGYAQCWDPKGWFWKPAEAAKDLLNVIQLETETGQNYDFGDYTSMTLTVNAWGCLEKKDYKGVEIYTKKCISLYETEAVKQQGELTDYLPKEKAFNPWALNDVGTCYFILGESCMEQNKHKEAKEAYSTIIDKFSFSQCWDPRGWFWKPAVGARGKINKLIAEHGV